MGYKENYDNWLANADDETKAALASMDEKEKEDAFYKDLEFGTAGLRGIMGPGTNRMNRYTVAKASKGLAAYLHAVYGDDVQRGVVIAFDSRNHSWDFAVEAARVLTSAGISVRLFEELEPIPVLSFAVKHFHAVGGVVVTASHNTKEYNGYKVYGPNGAQLVPKDADVLTGYVEAVKDLFHIDDAGREDLLSFLGQEVVDQFVEAVSRQSFYKGNPPHLTIVYTPLHGSGLKPVLKTLQKAGFSDIYVVRSQEKPDGDFPTVTAPNPENEEALSLGIALGQKMRADIVLGTDPDSDRIGAAVRTGDTFRLISGNQMGALLTYFVLSMKKDRLTPASTMVKTVVTGELGADIAKSFGVQVVEVLTGFKYIGEKISQWENDPHHDFVLGYEESYGYLVGTHAQDKDAVVAAMLIAEMAAHFKAEGKTLWDVLQDLYRTYGYYYDKTTSYTRPGMEGLAEIQAMMKKLRSMDVKSIIPDIDSVIDYEKGVGDFPRENVLKFPLRQGGWMAVRPSGTEPKIKIYYSLKGKDEEETLAKFHAYQEAWENALGL